MPSGSFLAWFTIIIIQVINSEAFKNTDFTLFELSCLSDSRMTCICDLCYSSVTTFCKRQAAACIPPRVRWRLLLQTRSPPLAITCHHSCNLGCPLNPSPSPSKLFGGRMSCFPFCVISPGTFSFQSSPWRGHLWSQSRRQYRPTCAWHLQTLPCGP